ncbi:MAG TPA: DedA family protein [Terriglobales bacterium]|nr:DedA family protein [Terriglobales bacterium]
MAELIYDRHVPIAGRTTGTRMQTLMHPASSLLLRSHTCNRCFGDRNRHGVGHLVSAHLNYYFDYYGYWTVLFGLLAESAGVPLPGETILILATLQASTRHQMNVVYVAVVAVVAATMGDNLGYLLGCKGGRPLLDRYRHVFHVKAATIRRGEELIERHGAVAVFFARFVAALRVLAGPLAGTLRMRWRSFLFFNALGAIAWVTTIVTLAYFFGPSLESALKHASWTIIGLLVVAVAFYWWHHARANRGEQDSGQQAA